MMRSQQFGFAISFLFHSTLVAMVFLTGGQATTAKAPRSLNFQLISENLNDQIQQLSSFPMPAQKEAPQILAKDLPVKKPVPEIKQDSLLVEEQKIQPHTAAIISPDNEIKDNSQNEVVEEVRKTLPKQFSAENTSAEKHETVASASIQAPVPQDSNEGNILSFKDYYIKENYEYIQGGIQKIIVYPRMARKMGWEGKVVVCFVICKDGHVENMRIIKSSGFSALDKNALETIKKAAPFPNPPAKAELTVPVIYRLREA